jgi:hypothetical protein
MAETDSPCRFKSRIKTISPSLTTGAFPSFSGQQVERFGRRRHPGHAPGMTTLQLPELESLIDTWGGPDVHARRWARFEAQCELDPSRFAFIDETGRQHQVGAYAGGLPEARAVGRRSRTVTERPPRDAAQRLEAQGRADG